MDRFSELAFLLDLFVFRQKREALEARLARLEDVRAQTDQLLREIRMRIDRSIAAFEHSPSIVPEQHHPWIPTLTENIALQDKDEVTADQR